MKKALIILLCLMFFVNVANSQSLEDRNPEQTEFERLRESGALLVLFFFAVFGGFYLFCILLVLLAGATEKKINATAKSKRKVKVNTNRRRAKNNARLYISGRRPKQRRAAA